MNTKMRTGNKPWITSTFPLDAGDAMSTTTYIGIALLSNKLQKQANPRRRMDSPRWRQRNDTHQGGRSQTPDKKSQPKTPMRFWISCQMMRKSRTHTRTLNSCKRMARLLTLLPQLVKPTQKTEEKGTGTPQFCLTTKIWQE